ncbi:MAG: hypothetical protein JXR96_25700 [Deltaproteobacteria bacterium]|nr:hypothetical protein [Deltaproteobacteria bacterium]
MQVQQATQAPPAAAAPSSDAHLDSLTAKLCAADWSLQCQQLMSATRQGEYRVQRQAIQSKHEAMQRYIEEQIRLRKEAEAAARRSGICKLFGKVLGYVAAAVCAVASVYCPAMLAVAVVCVTAASAGSAAAGTYYDGVEARKQADAVRANGKQVDASADRQQTLDLMEQTVQMEDRMRQRLDEYQQTRHETSMLCGDPSRGRRS